MICLYQFLQVTEFQMHHLILASHRYFCWVPWKSWFDCFAHRMTDDIFIKLQKDWETFPHNDNALVYILLLHHILLDNYNYHHARFAVMIKLAHSGSNIFVNGHLSQDLHFTCFSDCYRHQTAGTHSASVLPKFTSSTDPFTLSPSCVYSQVHFTHLLQSFNPEWQKLIAMAPSITL